MVDETIGGVGEFQVIRQLTRDLPSLPAVSLGVGDDAAAFLVNGSALCTVDLLVEGVHFRRDWSSAHDVGRKAVAVNVADIEAMGGTPVALVLGLSAPPETPLAWLREFMTGFRDEAAVAGVAVVGGDTTSGPQIVVSVTVIGQTDEHPPVTRAGAAPGEVVAFKGRLGWAAAGLAVLGRGFRSPRAAVDAQRVPAVPYGAGREAREAGATAMIDVSDGLVADLGHIAEASGVVIDLDLARLPVAEPLEVVGRALGRDPLDFVLGGGEDHALVACFESGLVPDDWTVIGLVRPVEGEHTAGVLVEGEPWSGSRGWDHFRS